MHQEFNEATGLLMNRDDQGAAREWLHLNEPFLSREGTAQSAAAEYLRKFGSLMGIQPDQLRNLGLSPDKRPTDALEEYRFFEEKGQFDTTTVIYSQTYFGLPVWEAGLAVHLRLDPLVVLSAHTTGHSELYPERPSERAVSRLEKLTEAQLAKQLGLSREEEKGSGEKFDLDSFSIKKRRLLVFRYRANRRFTPLEDNGHGQSHDQIHAELHLRLPLPPVSKDLQDGKHYVAAEIIFTLDFPSIPGLHWRAIVEAETLSVLFLQPLVDSVDGLVFLEDPITDLGGPLPNASTASLNMARTNVLLPGLTGPLAGSYPLTGDIVQLKDVEPPAVAPPVEPAGTDFDFNSRTDSFAAVNAYYHCDRFFRLVKELGFDLHTYFGGTNFPTIVDHRGMGVTVNAHCLGNGSFGILQTTFALADLTNIVNPIGIACDYRVVLHELGGHGILYNHVNGPNFGFAHSAGDSFGAVLCDATSQAPDRFVTFPWVNIGRRHDRSVAAGWGWGGVLDTGGYNSEQILCTSHFRIYRAIGGDSTEVAMRKFAGRYMAYLILRTVGMLTQPTNPPTSMAYAADLMSAELGNWVAADQVGGVYWKVIRWAFEKQGLFQPLGAPTPVWTEGAPPPIDVFIEDGRHGEYQYGPANQYPYLQTWWETTEIWNRHDADGHLHHQTPIVGKINHAYVRVRNRGTQPATGVIVHGYHCRPGAGLVWPDDFQPMKTTSFAIPGSIPPGGDVLAGPFYWKPKHKGHDGMYMTVSAIGDRANDDAITLLPAALGPSPLWRLVASDNNIGIRAVIPVPGGGHRRALVAAFRKRRFWASNPTAKTGRVEVRAILPSFLTTRGWAVQLANPGSGLFTLGPRDSRMIRPRLIDGQNFTAAEVAAAGEVAIRFVVLVDGLVVGGLTYVLDPALKEPPLELEEQIEKEIEELHEEEEHEHHEHHHHEHHDHHDRRIRLDIDLD